MKYIKCLFILSLVFINTYFGVILIDDKCNKQIKYDTQYTAELEQQINEEELNQ